MTTVLVTGGAGFIGSHVCERLLKDKKIDRVVCVDNLDPAYPAHFKRENLSLLSQSKKFKFYKADIRKKIPLTKIFKKEDPTYIIHLAAKTDTRLSLNEPESHISVNILGTMNLLELSKDHSCRSFVFISSSSVYGNSATNAPIKETESSDFPLSPYAATKKAGEVLAHTYSYNYGLPVACLRLFNVYGERMRPGVVMSRWVENILNDMPIEISGTGTRKRDFTYVGDVAEAIIKAMRMKKGYEIFNTSASDPASLSELLEIVENASGKKAKVKTRPSNRASIEMSHGNISKIKKLLKWSPRTSLEDGVSRYISWFRANRAKNPR